MGTDDGPFRRGVAYRTVAKYIQGKSLRDPMSISAGYVLDALPDLPDAHRHCAILSVMTFYEAIGQLRVEQAHS